MNFRSVWKDSRKMEKEKVSRPGTRESFKYLGRLVRLLTSFVLFVLSPQVMGIF